MPHDARAVASEFINRAIDDGRPITQLQTLKLVYFAHAWMLAYHDRALVRQTFYAWRHGPVVPDVYHALKSYGWRPITERVGYVSNRPYAGDELEIIDMVHETYGKFSGTYLSALTHGVGTPWDQVWQEGSRDIVISNQSIKEYYLDQLSERQTAHQ